MIEILDPNVFSPSERQKLLNWFNGLAEVQYEASVRQGAKNWDGRGTDNYVYKRENRIVRYDGKILPPYYGGAPLPGSMRSYNNRTYAAAAYLAVVGVHQNRQDYRDEAKLMVKEYLFRMCICEDRIQAPSHSFQIIILTICGSDTLRHG